MTRVSYDSNFLRQVIKGEIWFKHCSECGTSGFDYKTREDCEKCDGLGYVPVVGFKP